MVSTPEKPSGFVNLQSLTPVRFLDSPKAKSPSSDSNVAACKSRVETIVKTIIDNFTKWQLAEKRGLALCSSIEAIKTKALEKLNSDINSEDFITAYPNELKIYCDKLAVISSIFKDITENARQSLKEFKAFLVELLERYEEECKIKAHVAEHLAHCTTRSDLIRCSASWEYPQYIDSYAFLVELLERYEEECKIKAHVAEHLAHCTTRSDLIRCSASWEYPQYIDSYVKLMFIFIKEEINFKN